LLPNLRLRLGRIAALHPMRCGQQGVEGGDAKATLRRLGDQLTPHDEVLERILKEVSRADTKAQPGSWCGRVPLL
jgi:hypothetical protein